jgi:alpha-L-fucosidase
MPNPILRANQFSQAMALLAILGFLFIPSPANAQNSSTAPTITKDPAILDAEWQKASAKYDGPRNAILKKVDESARRGPFRVDWQSLEEYQVPEWYKDAKFGIFIHWGVYSAFGTEWYPREMYRPESQEFKHHIETYGSQEKFGYKDFIPLFKAEHFDAGAWARLFREAGAKYVVPVAEHHDGFAMYDSDLSDWTAGSCKCPFCRVVGKRPSELRAKSRRFTDSSTREGSERVCIRVPNSVCRQTIIPKALLT